MQLRPERQLNNFLKLDTLEQLKPNINYQLILSRGKWYAVGNGNGQAFTPENGIWKRVDQTHLEGFHYGAFLFDCNGTLMKYGGYGFWRNHGMFVYFHEPSGDWKIQPSDRNLPYSGNLAYFSRNENTLYSFGNCIHDQSTSDEKKYLDSLYRIDLLKMKWENLGKLNYELIDKHHLYNRLVTLPNSQGCFVLPISTDSTALFLDFKKLKYSLYNSKNNPRLFHFFRELPSYQQVYSDSYGLKILDTEEITTIDSLAWEIALANPQETSELIEGQTTTVSLKYSFVLLGIGLSMGIIILFYIRKRKKSKRLTPPISTTPDCSTALNLSITNTIIFLGAMYPIDAADFIVLKNFLRQDSSTIDLNEWLGLENKQPENQKKQRAEWIKRMNLFFYSIGFKEDAFYRERQETDRRMFVYKMNIKLKENHSVEIPNDEK